MRDVILGGFPIYPNLVKMNVFLILEITLLRQNSQIFSFQLKDAF